MRISVIWVIDVLFRRKIYDSLIEWKQRAASSRALLIEGARRVGKSTVAEEFGKNEYESYLLVDFAKASEAVKDAFSRYVFDNVGAARIGLCINKPPSCSLGLTTYSPHNLR